MDTRRKSPADGVYRSRKFVLTIMGLLLITLMSLTGIWYTTTAAILPTFVGGILGVLSLYMTGNVMNKYVIGKTAASLQIATQTHQNNQTKRSSSI